jgi:CxxC-x17-CxxC domain-containing protein
VEEKIERWSGMMIIKSGVKAAPTDEVFRPAAPKREAVARPIIERPTPQPEKKIAAVPVMKAAFAAEDERKVAQEPIITKQSGEIAEEKSAQVASVAPVAEKTVEKYETLCSTCEQQITVPFKPDPKRPAFCKECLKDYQRAMARVRSDQGTQNQPVQRVEERKQDRPVQKSEHRSELVGRAPQGRSMSLSQMAHVAPKKFKQERKKPNVDLGAIRKLIDESKG